MKLEPERPCRTGADVGAVRSVGADAVDKGRTAFKRLKNIPDTDEFRGPRERVSALRTAGGGDETGLFESSNIIFPMFLELFLPFLYKPF